MGDLSIADALERAADLIEPEGAWTQDDIAKDANGRPCFSQASEAVCFCAGGAILRSARHEHIRQEAMEFLEEKVLGLLVTSWNDAPERTQAEVVAKLREAAALAREQGK